MITHFLDFNYFNNKYNVNHRYICNKNYLTKLIHKYYLAKLIHKILFNETYSQLVHKLIFTNALIILVAKRSAQIIPLITHIITTGHTYS